MPQQDKVTVLIKATPNPSKKYGETICCAGIDPLGNWRRLFPINYRKLSGPQQFKRWDIIQYDWVRPSDDRRIESNRVQSESIVKVRSVNTKLERIHLISRSLADDREKELASGKTFALIKPEIIEFGIEKRDQNDVLDEQRRFDSLRKQANLFSTDQTVPLESCPYKFFYKFVHNGKNSKMYCQDWETTATFYNQKRQLGSADAALDFIQETFGKRYPEQGCVFALGTNSKRKNQWLLNAIIKFDHSAANQPDLF